MTEKNHGNGRPPRQEEPMSDLELRNKQLMWALAALLEGLRVCAAADYLPQCQVVIKGPAQGVPQPAKGVGAVVEYRVEWLLTEPSLKDVENLVAAVLPGAGPVPQ